MAVGGLIVDEHLVKALECFGQVVLQGGEGGTDGRRAETVRDEAEVRQTALDARLQDGRRARVPQWSTVLCQEVRELLTQLPECGKERHTESTKRFKCHLSECETSLYVICFLISKAFVQTHQLDVNWSLSTVERSVTPTLFRLSSTPATPLSNSLYLIHAVSYENI